MKRTIDEIRANVAAFDRGKALLVYGDDYRVLLDRIAALETYQKALEEAALRAYARTFPTYITLNAFQSIKMMEDEIRKLREKQEE